MRIGILGGTFDPPHVGHLAVAKAAKEHLGLDEVMFMPANRNPLKTRRDVSSPEQRLAMVQLAIAEESSFSVSDMEITRGGPSYTVDTLSELQMIRQADFWFILGADSLKTITDWKSPNRIARLCRLAVSVRPPMTEHDVAARLPDIFEGRADMVPIQPNDVSSTEVRERIVQGRPITGMVTPKVEDYIRRNKLYKV